MRDIPNCVPEYYRGKEEKDAMEGEVALNRINGGEGYRELGEYYAVSHCDECPNLKGIASGDEYNPINWVCTENTCMEGKEHTIHLNFGDIIEIVRLASYLSAEYVLGDNDVKTLNKLVETCTDKEKVRVRKIMTWLPEDRGE